MKSLIFSIPISTFIYQTLLILSRPVSGNLSLFREYIGAEFLNVTFSDVPIDPRVEIHLILSFAIDYTTNLSNPSPTNGKFEKFWDTDNLTPSQASAIKTKHRNVKLAVSLGGDSIGHGLAYFDPKDKDTWVSNAVCSLTSMIKEYKLSGIDIDYEHFKSDPMTFSECIGKLIKELKESKVISFASIAPFADLEVQKYYLALWKNWSDIIDYVNFQFYAYDNTTTVRQFIQYFNNQSESYKGGKILTSFISDGSHGLGPTNGFLDACNILKRENKLNGIFVWCADESKAYGFEYEKKSQELLANLC